MPAPWRSQPPTPSLPKPPRPFWKTWKFYDRLSDVLIPVGLIIWISAAGDPEQQFTPSRETTVLTSPITPQGLVDYAGAIREQIRDEVRSPDNAVRLLVSAVGPSIFRNASEAEQAYEQLDIEPLPPNGNYFVSIDDVASRMARRSGADASERQRVVWDLWGELKSRPWTAAEAPEYAQWLDLNEVPLARVVEASQLPTLRGPLLLEEGHSLFASRSIHCEMRPLYDALRTRSMLKLGNGDLDGAWQDLLAVYRLGRMTSRETTWMDYAFGTIVERHAVFSTSAVLSSPDMTPEMLGVIRNDWHSLPSRGDASISIDTHERYALLDVMQRTARIGAPFLVASGMMDEEERIPLEGGVHRLFNACIDWDASMWQVNQWHDRWVLAAATPDGNLRDARFDALIADFEDMRSELRGRHCFIPNPETVSGLCVGMLASIPETIKSNLNATEASCALIETAFAIEDFRFTYGRLPDSLAELVPQFLPEAPHDPFSRTDQLRYEVEDAEGYVLYSMGQDGNDDGGLTEHKDISFRVRMPTPDWLDPDPLLAQGGM